MPTRLGHQPLCQAMISLTSDLRDLPAHVGHLSGSPLRESTKGVHVIWARDWQSSSSPATAQLKRAVLFVCFLSSFCPCFSVRHKKTHKHTHIHTHTGPDAAGHTKADVRDFIWLRRWVWAPLGLPPPAPPPTSDPHHYYQADAHMFFFFIIIIFAGQAGRVLLSRAYFIGSNEAGWHCGTHTWPVLVPGWAGRARGVKAEQPCPGRGVDSLCVSSTG